MKTKKQETFYKHYKINKKYTGWRYHREGAFSPKIKDYCPLCDQVTNLVIVNWMRDWLRCERCLLKLPVKNKKTMKLLGMDEKTQDPKQLIFARIKDKTELARVQN